MDFKSTALPVEASPPCPEEQLLTIHRLASRWCAMLCRRSFAEVPLDHTQSLPPSQLLDGSQRHTGSGGLRGPAPPTPPPAPRATACASTLDPSRSLASTPSPWCRTSPASPRSSYCVSCRSKPCRCIPMATWPTPGQESSQVRNAQSARSYEGVEHPAQPRAARRSWPRWSTRATR